MTCRIVVLLSGSGSNLQALIDSIQQSAEHPAQIVAVVSNVADAFGLERARNAKIATQVLDHRSFTERTAYDQALIALIDQYQPDLVVLAGFMRILSSTFVAHYQGRLLNIHPSLLPAFKGLNTHARALAEGAHEHGCSVHFVTAELDGGPLVLQARLAVLPDESSQALGKRVLALEHQIYPQAVRWFAQGRIQLIPEGVQLDGTLLPASGFLFHH